MVSPNDSSASPPYWQIRALYTDTTVTVYQAYSDEIAQTAVRAQTFLPPFKRDRMTWIKPSFLWMMYRSGWGTKEGQKRVLAIDITRSGFQWCLAHACLSSYNPAIHCSEEAWRQSKMKSPVRAQWDPERSIRLTALDHRSIQIGLSGLAVEKYVGSWIVRIRDVTSLARKVYELVEAGDEIGAVALLPREAHYRVAAPHLGITL